MKQLEEPTPITPDAESAMHAHHKTLKRIGQMVYKPGLTLWEINKAEGTIVEAKYEDVMVVGKGMIHKVIVNKDCYYLQALNLKNAAKKASKLK